MPYTVKEIFYTLQGEGLQSGRPAVFCRFSGCNLWNGKNKDRMNATCQFCDTDFVGTDGPGGGRFEHAHTLVEALRTHWPKPDQPSKFVVLTGGEPLLQVDAPLLKALSKADFEIAVETNGTQKAPEGIDHLCVSPKTAELKQNHGTEYRKVFTS